jgi:hypothetical protein
MFFCQRPRFACALLRVQDLIRFDLTLWFSRAIHTNNPTPLIQQDTALWQEEKDV